MRIRYCPVCGMPVHEEVVIPPTAEKPGDEWVLWFCDRCKWVSDWPGMPDMLKKPGWSGPVSDPKEATGGAYGQ